MASAAVLKGFQQRAIKADRILLQLREQLDILKGKAATLACKEEEGILRKENAQLKEEVNFLKEQLMAVEIKNGVEQVPLPKGLQPTNTVALEHQKNQSPVTLSNNKMEPQQKTKKEKQINKGSGNKGKAQESAKDRVIDVSMLNMRIGEIVNVTKHPDADTLYVEEVDLGEERNRTIVSGLVKHVPIEQMQNRIAIFLCNLKPAKMRGIMSEGMIMCGSSPEKVEIIEAPAGSQKGERVIVEGYEGNPEQLLNPKKKIFDQIQPDLRINEEGIATYKGALWKVEGRDGKCTVATMRNSGIK